MNTTHVEWLNQNALRAYPFDENCSRRPLDGDGGSLPEAYAVPNYVLVDFVATMPADRMERLFMSQMTLAGGILTMVFSTASESPSPVAAATVGLSDGMGLNEWSQFSGSGEYADVRGAVVIGNGSRMLSDVPDGIYVFSPEATLLEARCVRPSLAGVSSIRAVSSDGMAESSRLQGDVSLMAGENIRLRYDPPRNAIWIDAESDIGYAETCECEQPRRCLSSVNGISTDTLRISGGDCVKVVVGTKGEIRIEDTCSKPCCGCEELTWLNRKENEIATAIERLRGFAERISDRIDSIVDAGMINGLLEDRDKFIPYHEVSRGLRESPNWNKETREAHLAAGDDVLESRLYGQHIDWGGGATGLIYDTEKYIDDKYGSENIAGANVNVRSAREGSDG